MVAHQECLHKLRASLIVREAGLCVILYLFLSFYSLVPTPQMSRPVTRRRAMSASIEPCRTSSTRWCRWGWRWSKMQWETARGEGRKAGRKEGRQEGRKQGEQAVIVNIILYYDQYPHSHIPNVYNIFKWSIRMCLMRTLRQLVFSIVLTKIYLVVYCRIESLLALQVASCAHPWKCNLKNK